MKKIIITGANGVGKSHFAARLAEARPEIPMVSFDAIKLLTDGSPSCGTSFVYDGSFSGVTKPGMGVTAAALRDAGLQVWPETAIRDLDAQLRGNLKRAG